MFKEEVWLLWIVLEDQTYLRLDLASDEQPVSMMYTASHEQEIL